MGCHTYLIRAQSTAALVHGYEMLQALLDRYAVSQVVPFDHAAEQIHQQLTAQRIRIGSMDLRIGSIALARNLILTTRNSRDFGRIPGLVIENWTN